MTTVQLADRLSGRRGRAPPSQLDEQLRKLGTKGSFYRCWGSSCW